MRRSVRIINISPRRSATRRGRLGKAVPKPEITAEQFRDARVFGGLTRAEAAEFLGVSLRTVGHWERGRTRPAYAAFKLLRVYRHGAMIDPAWSGYRLSRGHLVTPEGHSFAPHDMAWLSLLVRRAKAFSVLLEQRDGACPAGLAGASVGRKPGRATRRGGAESGPTGPMKRGLWRGFAGEKSPGRSSTPAACREGPSSNTGQKLAQSKRKGAA